MVYPQCGQAVQPCHSLFYREQKGTNDYGGAETGAAEVDSLSQR